MVVNKYPWIKPSSYDSPATTPEKHLLKVELMRVFFSLNYQGAKTTVLAGVGEEGHCREGTHDLTQVQDPQKR